METTIASHQRTIARTVARRRTRNRQDKRRAETLTHRLTPKHQEKRADRMFTVRKTPACCLTPQETVKKPTDDSTLIEDMEFVVNSATLAAMETKTTLRQEKNAKTFAMVSLILATLLRSTADALRTLQSGTLMLTHKSVKNLSSVAARATRTTLMTNGLARMLAFTMESHPRRIHLHQFPHDS